MKAAIKRSRGTAALKVYALLQERVDDAYRVARLFNYSYSQLNNILCDIRESPEWIATPKHIIIYMKGYMSGAYNSHIATHPRCVPPK